MRKPYRYLILIFLVAAVAGVLWLALHKSTVTVENYRFISRTPNIKPDYTNTVIPPNIAPLNFMVLEPGVEYLVKIYSTQGESIDVSSRTGKIKIPIRRWRSLLNANRGKKLLFDIYVKNKSGLWSRHVTIINAIAKEDIDSYLVYRFMKPLFNWWRDIGIYQRNLENYDKSVVLHGKSFNNGCLNCHTFLNNRPEYMTIGIRSALYGSSALLTGDGKVNKIGTKWGYNAWHPSGQLVTYSMIKVRQFFHKTTKEVRDVVDLDSGICYYQVDSQKIKTAPALSEPNRMETYPTWSPDGHYLYFCSAPILWKDRETVPPVHFDEVKYDLRRVAYNVKTDEWGQSETVLSADETGMSMLCPRISPDGRFLVFCMCEYGCFPVYQASSDLYLMDLKTGKYKKLTLNSENSESWHSFSSNSRWLAFSSKRRDGLFTRIFFSYIDETGQAHKPFILPQKDPAYYDSLLRTYSVPELITSKVKTSSIALARAARSTDKIEPDLPITGATPSAKQTTPWQTRE
jgi:Tol biopolymer transport system component